MSPPPPGRRARLHPALHPSLAGLDLVVFDKDGTLIEFHAMWGGWVTDLADRIEAATARPVRGPLLRAIGFDEATGRADPLGSLAAMPMAVLRDLALDVLRGAGVEAAAAEAAIAASWRPPDPVALARPLTDLGRLFRALHDAGSLVAVATSDDRSPTERTIEALGVAGLIDALVCADDGVPVKPDPAPIRRLSALTGAATARTAMVGDSPADMRMGRAAGVRTCIGVLSGTATLGELGPLADLVLTSIDALLEDRAR